MADDGNLKQAQDWASGGAASQYLVGALHIGIFAFATKQVGPESAPVLGFWIVGCALVLLMLGMIELRRGEVVFGTIGMVFGGLLGLGGGLSFARSAWIPGVYAMDGWWFLSAGIIIMLLLLVIWKVSRIMFAGTAVIGVALLILGLAMMGVFASPDVPMAIAGWMALVFALFSWYQATAIMLVTVYGKKILPL